MINTQLFTQIGLDSGALTQLGSVVHPVSEPGDYRGVVLLGDDQVADFSFVVAKEGRTQLDIDVAALDGGGQDDDCGCGPTSHDATPWRSAATCSCTSAPVGAGTPWWSA